VARRTLKAAPRRPITSIDRHGDWGDTTYHHHLTCGHTEIRKRKSPAPALACSGCLTANEFAAGLFATPSELPTLDPRLDADATLDTEANRIRAALAKRFTVDPDAVDVAVKADDGIAYALVFLERDVALRLAAVDSTTPQ